VYVFPVLPCHHLTRQKETMICPPTPRSPFMNPSLPYAVPIRASCRGNIISDSKCPTNPQSSRLAPRYLAHEANALRGSRVEGPSGVESNGAAHVAPAVVARSWWKFWMRKTCNGCKPALCSTSRGRCTAKLISSARPCNSKENQLTATSSTVPHRREHGCDANEGGSQTDDYVYGRVC
jgi:hypothetical protein